MTNGLMGMTEALASAETTETEESLELWCKTLFKRLERDVGAINVALFVLSENKPLLCASLTTRVFHFYPDFRPAEEYGGYSIDWEKEASKCEKEFSLIGEFAVNGVWKKDNAQWEHTVLRLKKGSQTLAYLFVESECTSGVRAFYPTLFDWVYDTAAENLKYLLLKQQLAQVKSDKHQNELNLALNNHQLSSQLSYIKSLHEISLRFTKATTIHALCRIAVELGRSKLQIDRMGIFLCDMDSSEMWGTWGTDIDGNVVDRSDFRTEMPNNLFMEEAFSKKNQLIVKENVPLYFGTKQVGVGWNIMMVMWDGDNCIGWLAADNLLSQSVLDEPKKEAFKLLAASVCQKIIKLRETEAADERYYALQEQIRLQAEKDSEVENQLMNARKQMRWLEVRDEKLGLLNATYLDLALPRFVKMAKDEKMPVTAGVVSIDFFQGYKKQYGELPAQRLMMSIADDLKCHLRDFDDQLLCLIKEGQFAFLVKTKDEVHLRDIATKIVDETYHRNIENDTSNYYQRVTLSLGIAVNCAGLFTKPIGVLKKAEKACLIAEKLGRNRFCID
ncbi:GGDEF domain-containing protein [Enterovibrio sp. ZSDZ35]|uniref:GGDEF domain-containing protein n=1 Tax=Enterovibrio qingdaonensis TaxID=2899818 RepID=A0ABT5QGI0_9GAMM|nr:GGDEF domain-containing protein [Enterovibrio sp. ZSDZ35]MDD1779595.1 GGDEF domain-containing protein [Enterovibrio sp. ZSDZ35]